MAKQWKKFERLVAAIHHAESQGAAVTWNDSVNGRQFDVTIRFKHGLHEYLTVIECKDYSGRVPVEKVEAFVTKSKDVLADKAVMVSTNGFQAGCIEVAKKHNVRLLVLSELRVSTISDSIASYIPGLRISNVRFVGPGSEETRFDEECGHLGYVAKHAVIAHAGGKASPDDFISRWKAENLARLAEVESEAEIILPSGARLSVPYYPSRAVVAIRFTHKIGSFGVAKHGVTVEDPRVRAGLDTRIELRDAAGELQYSDSLSQLHLGFDSPLEVGKFYTLPALGSNYYCEAIEGELVRWALVESYQFDDLLQGRFTQKVLPQGHYVEVVDEDVLRRLRLMLADLQERCSLRD